MRYRELAGHYRKWSAKSCCLGPRRVPGIGGLSHAQADKDREVTKLDGVRLHDLRHSFASFAAADGASLYLIGKALGHRQATTTERYAHLTDDPIKAVAEQVAVRFRLPAPRPCDPPGGL